MLTESKKASCIVLGFLVGRLLWAQSTEQHPFTISENVDLVLLDVGVRDSQGHFVPGLKKSNFTVFDDGRKTEIRNFNTFDAPVALGLVVDSSGSMALKRVQVINAELAFAKQSNPGDQFFVVNFNDSVTRGLPPGVRFTDNLQMLRKALYFGLAAGQTALYDALSYSLKHLELSTLQRRSLIVVTDGRDNVSEIRFDRLMKEVEASRATIYTVGLRDPDSDNDLNAGVLRKISHVSGGEFFEPPEPSETASVFQEISKDLRHRYTIGYIPDESSDHRVLRTIKVVAREGNRKLKVHTRTSYKIAPGAYPAANDAMAEAH
jgi:Ca-activated chloride channel family protein